MECILYMSTSRGAQVIFTKFFQLRSFFVPVCICVMFRRRTRAQPGRGGGSGSLWVKPCGAVSCCFGASSQLLTGHQLVLQSYYMDLSKLFYWFAKVTKLICKTFFALSCCCFGASSQLLKGPQCFSVKEVTCISQSCCMYLQLAAAALELAVSCYAHCSGACGKSR